VVQQLGAGQVISRCSLVAVDRNNGELAQHLFFEIKGFAAA
jgi:hypothetical protein